MRRKEKAIKSRAEIESLLRRSAVCRLALTDGDQPYLVPLNFGYGNNTLYFHSAREGRKLDLIRKNNKVCFVVDGDHELVRSDKACKWSMKYRSVIGSGRAFLVEDPDEKQRALDLIMGHHAEGPFAYSEKELRSVAVVRIEIHGMTGKQSGY